MQSYSPININISEKKPLLLCSQGLVTRLIFILVLHVNAHVHNNYETILGKKIIESLQIFENFFHYHFDRKKDRTQKSLGNLT